MYLKDWGFKSKFLLFISSEIMAVIKTEILRHRKPNVYKDFATKIKIFMGQQIEYKLKIKTHISQR